MKRIAIVTALIISGTTLLHAQTRIEEFKRLLTRVRMKKVTDLSANNLNCGSFYLHLTIRIPNTDAILLKCIFHNPVEE
jgi:hypothetical protein